MSQEKLIKYFKSFLQTRIKTVIAQVVIERKLSIFQMDAQLATLSDEVKAHLQSDFKEYGLELTQMMVTTIVKPEGDPIYEQFKNLYFRQYAAVKKCSNQPTSRNHRSGDDCKANGHRGKRNC